MTKSMLVFITLIALFMAYIAWLHLEIASMKKENKAVPTKYTQEFTGVQTDKILYSY